MDDRGARRLEWAVYALLTLTILVTWTLVLGKGH